MITHKPLGPGKMEEKTNPIKIIWLGCPIWLAPISRLRMPEPINGKTTVIMELELGVPPPPKERV